MSGCLGRDLPKKLCSVAEVLVGVLEFWLCYVLPCAGREKRGGGVPAPWDGRQRQESSP